MYITLDQQINQYSRTVYSFWDMLGYIGGIYGLLYSFGNFVFSFFMQKVLHFSLLSNLYHIETQTKTSDLENKFDEDNLKNICDKIENKKEMNKESSKT